MAVMKRVLCPRAGARLGGALAQRPGRTMAEHGLVAELLDVAVVHALEIVPGLVVGAGMGGAIPDIFGQVLGRLGDAAAAGADAILGLAQPLFRFGRGRAFPRLDADIALETRTGLSHRRIMG